MVVDTSVLVAILIGEPDAGRYAKALDETEFVHMSAASLLELSIVVESRFGAKGRKQLDALFKQSGIEVSVVTRAQVEIAREGFRRFGKGRHPAALNFGDCFSYGLAKSLHEPLLFQGNDFGLTDVLVALP